jgi:hypothetical protein
MNNTVRKIKLYLQAPVYSASLSFFRVLFGVLMLFSLARFWSKGWIEDFYVKPSFYFSYYGFEWVKNPGDPWIYILFGILLISALCILLGFLYRINCIIFFTLFTYIELIDQSNYLNHYYLISLISFLLIFIPAHHHLSLDSFFNLHYNYK